ncbi:MULTISPECIES: ACP S-malonyltransferase [unclassified Streptomyces]|uniref:ACP S-malonyltransferase n=1 Tax=unclassified Streptomyces TaxID=2593676 RepID=UPI00093D33E5|nr:ACP S-malonyltransferase [Streptomyces sp. CB01883]
MSVVWAFPGQGSQRKDMGVGLFDRHPGVVARADAVLGRSVRELSADQEALRDTRALQPVLYTISALTYLDLAARGPQPDFMIGHSLGEYSALYASGAVDFETGLRLVVARAEIMGGTSGGGMLAVVGLDVDRLREVLRREGADDIDLANHNSPVQSVLSGPEESIRELAPVLRRAGAGKCVLLHISVAAHSRYMAEAARRLGAVLDTVTFREPRVPVVSNVTARPHRADEIATRLREHMCQGVRWWESLAHLVDHGVTDLVEVGPGNVLTKLWAVARAELPGPAAGVGTLVGAGAGAGTEAEVEVEVEVGAAAEAEVEAETEVSEASREVPAAVPGAVPPGAGGVTPAAGPMGTPSLARAGRPTAERLGAARFRERYGLRLAWVASGTGDGAVGEEVCRAAREAGLAAFADSVGPVDFADQMGPSAFADQMGPAGFADPRGPSDFADPTGPAARTGPAAAPDAGRVPDGPRTAEAPAEALVQAVTAAARHGWGIGLRAGPGADRLVTLLLDRGVRHVEADHPYGPDAALVRFRFTGARRTPAGTPVARRHVLARVSGLDQAAAFLRPPSPDLLAELVRTGGLSAQEADAARELPVASDLAVQAPAGWHADGADAYQLLPSVAALAARGPGPEPVHVGLRGVVGTPEQAATAFALGAAFLVSTSLTACAPNARLSAQLGRTLTEVTDDDLTWAPTERYATLGVPARVVRRGTLFPARAHLLHRLLRAHRFLAEVPAARRRHIEEEVLGGPAAGLPPGALDGRVRTTDVFRWYVRETARRTGAGDPVRPLDHQLPCDPELTHFNRAALGTGLAARQARTPGAVAGHLLTKAAELLAAGVVSRAEMRP